MDQRQLDKVIDCLRIRHQHQVIDDKALRESHAVITLPQYVRYVAIKSDAGTQGPCADFIVFVMVPPKLVVVAIETKGGGGHGSGACQQLQGALGVAQDALSNCGADPKAVEHLPLWIHGSGVRGQALKALKQCRPVLFGRRRPIALHAWRGGSLDLNEVMTRAGLA